MIILGKVFSWDEIKDNKVPQLESFSTVTKCVKNKLETTDGIIGSILCGSILFNKYTVRSDIDCVVIYDPSQRRNVVKTLRNIHQAAKALYVPVELIPLDIHTISTPLHHIEPSFAAHLQCAVENGGIIKRNPLPLFSFENINPDENVLGYFRNKLRKLEKGISEIPTMESELYRFLQKVLEAPGHVARKILWWNKVQIPNDSKQEVIRHYPQIASTQELELFIKLIEADDKYTKELLRQLQQLNENRYQQTIKDVKNIVWDTLEFVRLNAFRLANTTRR